MLDPRYRRFYGKATSSSNYIVARYVILTAFGLIIVQRGNSVIVKSLNESRIKANLDVFYLEKKDFDSIERIPWVKGQKRYGDWDELWGTELFANETLDLANES